MAAVVVETHSIVWYLSADPRLSATAADALESINRSEIPALPDRIVTAAAAALPVPLISRDGKICASQIRTIW